MNPRMRDLARGAEFRLDTDYRVPTHYRVTLPASEHEYGWVEVWNTSMTEREAQLLLATPGAVDPGCDPRDGVFMDDQVEMDVEVPA